MRPYIRPDYLVGTGVHDVTIDSFRPITANDVPDGDVIVATWWETAYWISKMPPKKGAKAYFMQDYGAPGQELDQIIPTWRLPLHMITISSWLAGLVREHVGEKNISLVTNGVDLNMFNAPPREKNQTPTIGHLFRFGVTKGEKLILEAFEIARRVLPDLRLIAFGGVSPPQEVTQHQGITYYKHPSDSQLGEIYAACDAWMFTSEREGFGLPILEAFACRTPVIATPAGAAPDLVNSTNGALLDSFEPLDIAKKIVEICRLDSKSWRSMSEAAFTTAVTNDWPSRIERFEAALRMAIELTPPKRNSKATSGSVGRN